MDPSAQPAQNVQDQSEPAQPAVQTPVSATFASSADSTQSAPPVASADPAQPVQPALQQKAPVSISVNKEAGPAVVVTESADPDQDDENEVKVAPQETQNQVIGSQGGAEVQETVELQPAVPEVAVENAEVEKIVEVSPDQEKPNIPKAVSDAGVTHSGPGIIVAPKNDFGIKEIPVTYEQAAIEEKQTDLHASKHWLMGVIMYVWRRINPELGKEKKTKKGRPVANKEPKLEQLGTTIQKEDKNS